MLKMLFVKFFKYHGLLGEYKKLLLNVKICNILNWYKNCLFKQEKMR